MKTSVSTFLVMAVIALTALPAYAAEQNRPAPVAALEQQGMTVTGQFDAPGGLTGYAARYRNRPIAIYVTPDSEHAVIGTLIDAQGRDLSTEPLQRLAAQTQDQDIWPRVEDSDWVADGSDQAERVVYMFTDPNCPYCHQFWQAARPWVEAGRVQIRHVLVGILKPSSEGKAAAILGADDPAAALARGERNYDSGGVTPLDNIPDEQAAKVNANNQMMQSFGLFATPAIVYHDSDGEVVVKQGLPQGAELKRIMGSPEP